MKRVIKTISVILTVIMFFSVFSASTTVFAEQYNTYVDGKAYEEKLLTETFGKENEKAEIVCEVPEKREEFSKTYKRADGSYTKVFSQVPLHTYENGEWKVVDNSLQSNGTSIENADGKFEVSFPETLSESNKIEIENQGENISFSLNNIEDSAAQITSQAATADVVKQDLSKTYSEIIYENIDTNTDVQYIISSNSVKENIIISEKASLKDTYSFDIEKGDLIATLGEDKSVAFKNPQNETVFTIPAPVMTDAENNISYNIDVAVTNADKTVLTLTYTPSKEWLDNAQYPVVIDPVIEIPSGDETIIEDTVVGFDSNIPELRNVNFKNFSDGVAVNTGSLSDGDLLHTDILVNINISAFSCFKNSSLEITDVNYYSRGKVECGNVLVKEINGTWDADTVTYDDVYPADGSTPQITYGTEIIDFASGGADMEYSLIYFNITDIFKASVKNNTNADFAIVAGDSEARGDFTSGGTETDRVFNSYISIDYVDTSCANDAFEYITQSIGRAGTVYVNTFSRSLSLTRSDISADGLRMPVSVDFAYNPALINFTKNHVTAEGINQPTSYGNNWLPLNIQAMFNVTGDQWQVFTGEGTLVTFNKKEESVTETVDGAETTKTVITFEEDETSDSGYALELINQTSGISSENMKLISPTGEVSYFNEDGFVVEICESEANADGTYDKNTIVYSEVNPFIIDYITDGVGRKYDFVYNTATGLISEIKCFTADGIPIKAGTTNVDLKVSYSYDENRNLTGVTYPDGESVAYTYDSAGNLIKVQNIDAYNILYTYDEYGKVTNIAEYADTTPGNTITLTQLSNRQVKVADAFSGIQTYQFGKDGLLHYTFDEKGNYCKSDYAPVGEENVYESYNWSISSENLLKNGGFEDVKNAKAVDWSNSFNVEDIETSDTLTDYVCRVASADISTDTQKQTITVNGGNAYTFSVYAKSNLTETSSTDKLYVAMTAKDENGSKTLESRSFTLTENFEQYSITVTKDTAISSVTVEFGFDENTGDFYVNNAQLENGNGTAEYNLVENGSFNNSDENWSTATIVDETLNTESVKAVKLSGGLPSYTQSGETYTLNDTVSAVTQNVKINGKKDDVYSVGGWFKGLFDDNYINSNISSAFSEYVPLPTSSSAQLKVTYLYTDIVTTTDETTNETTTAEQTLTENFTVDFAPHNEGWQYAVDSFALKGDVESVDVTVITKNIPSDTFATGIELTKNESAIYFEDTEETESTDTADTTTTSGTQTSTETEEGYVCVKCEIYGGTCICESEEICACIECKRGITEEYDNYGNIISTVKTDGVSTMTTETTYSTDGNHLIGAKDENEVVSTFTESSEKATALPLQVSIAGQTADYTFNSGTHLATVNKTVSGLSSGNQMNVSYIYDNDKITKVTHNGYSYNFEYDIWGNIAREKVGNQIIANYYYGTEQYNKQLQKTLYENGQSVWYRYDTLGNINGIKYSNDEAWRFIFDYSNTEKTSITDTVQNQLKEITQNSYTITDLTTDQIIYSETDSEETFNGATYTKTVNDEVCDELDGSTLYSSILSGVANSAKSLGFTKLVDWFERDAKKTVSINQNNSSVSLEKEFKYKSGAEENSTTQYIEEISNTVKTNDAVISAETLKYTYDIYGNIKTVSICVNNTTTLQYEYYYDETNQVVRVDDYINDTITVYQYDMGGNIVSVKEYDRATYTTESVPVSEDVYVYDSSWKDKVSSVNGQTLTYDLIGNLLTYNGKTHTWIAGRKLATFQNTDYSLAFKYDENGLRSQKTVTASDTTKAYKYTWVDGKLIGQTDGTNTLRFIFNDEAEVVGFVKNDNDIYLYIKNIFGDVIGIVDETGSNVVNYEYDVWGKLISVSGSLAETVGQLNPIRYRGYYYDTESGYYYLQSRYYDPELRRFINADKLEGLYTPKSTYLYADSVNVFVYCANSPVNMVDYSGEKESDNTSVYLANALMFSVLLEYYKNDIIKITSDRKLYDKAKISTHIYKNSKKGFIKISLNFNFGGVGVVFSDILYTFYLVLGNKVFNSLTSLALNKFKQVFDDAHNDAYPQCPTDARPFLFSNKCVKDEIKEHCFGYWYSVGKIDDNKSINGFMQAYSIFSKKGLKTHCEVIDIAEQDACDPVDRVLFDYFNGIRKKYMNTVADPYWRESGKRLENNVRNDWKKEMIPYDI